MKVITGMSRIVILVLFLSGIVVAILPTALLAHAGGTPRLVNVEAGPYRLYVWSDPDPWRVGEAHATIAVTKQNPNTSANGALEVPVTDAEVTLILTPVEGGDAITIPATSQTTFANYYYEGVAQLPSAGEWSVAVEIKGREGSGRAIFTLEVLPAWGVNWFYLGGAGVGLLLFVGVWASRQRPAPSARRPGRRRISKRVWTQARLQRPLARSHSTSHLRPSE
jgi:hypothetical protein